MRSPLFCVEREPFTLRLMSNSPRETPPIATAFAVSVLSTGQTRTSATTTPPFAGGLTGDSRHRNRQSSNSNTQIAAPRSGGFRISGTNGGNMVACAPPLPTVSAMYCFPLATYVIGEEFGTSLSLVFHS
jgi:hypothetical protein